MGEPIAMPLYNNKRTIKAERRVTIADLIEDFELEGNPADIERILGILSALAEQINDELIELTKEKYRAWLNEYLEICQQLRIQAGIEEKNHIARMQVMLENLSKIVEFWNKLYEIFVNRLNERLTHLDQMLEAVNPAINQFYSDLKSEVSHWNFNSEPELKKHPEIANQMKFHIVNAIEYHKVHNNSPYQIVKEIAETAFEALKKDITVPEYLHEAIKRNINHNLSNIFNKNFIKEKFDRFVHASAMKTEILLERTRVMNEIERFKKIKLDDLFSNDLIKQPEKLISVLENEISRLNNLSKDSHKHQNNILDKIDKKINNFEIQIKQTLGIDILKNNRPPPYNPETFSNPNDEPPPPYRP